MVSSPDAITADDEFTDVTLVSCEGKRLKGHNLIFAACSAYFKEAFKRNS